MSPLENGAPPREDDRPPPKDVPAGRGHLTVGNIPSYEPAVIVDGARVGDMRAGAQRTFAVGPGRHSVQVEALGYGHVRRHGSHIVKVDVQPDATKRIAFAPRRAAAPKANHSLSRQNRSFCEKRRSIALKAGILWSLAGILLEAAVHLAMLAMNMAAGWRETPATTPAMILVAGVLCGVAGTIAEYAPVPDCWVKDEGLLVEYLTGAPRIEKIPWKSLRAVTLVGSGPSAQVVVWYRDGERRARGDGQGTVLCRVREVGRGQDDIRFRAAPRWFAGDRYVERPSCRGRPAGRVTGAGRWSSSPRSRCSGGSS